MKVLFPYDGSAAAGAAISHAATLLGAQPVEALVLAVWEPLAVSAVRAAGLGSDEVAVPFDSASEDDRAADAARATAQDGARLAGEAGFTARAFSVADARSVAQAIVDAAEELDVDLVVMGSRGLGGVKALIGSVSRHVVEHSRRPVLIVPAAVAAASAEPATSALEA